MPIIRMSFPSMKEVSPEENLQRPLRNGRGYSAHNFSSDEKHVVVKWMRQDCLSGELRREKD